MKRVLPLTVAALLVTVAGCGRSGSDDVAGGASTSTAVSSTTSPTVDRVTVDRALDDAINVLHVLGHLNGSVEDFTSQFIQAAADG
jgi:predicted small lipoprotein YifL